MFFLFSKQRLGRNPVGDDVVIGFRIGGALERRDVRAVEEQIASLNQQRNDTLTAIQYARVEKVIRELESRFEQIEQEIARQHVILHEANARIVDTVLPLPLREFYAQMLDSWDATTGDEKRQVLTRLVGRVEIPTWRGRSLQVRIHWYDKTVTECDVWMRRGKGRWTYAEQVTIMRLLDEGASRETFLAALPGKSWEAVRHFIRRFAPDEPLPQAAVPSKYWVKRRENQRSEVGVDESRLRRAIPGGEKRPIIRPFPLELLKQLAS